MPYVRRDASGRIVALTETADPADENPELLDTTHPELAAFLGAPEARAFGSLDAGFIRVMEDLIDVLIEKGVLRLTDLPVEAQRKLLARKDMRQRHRNALNLLDDNGTI